MAGVTQRTVYRLRDDVDHKLGRLPLKYFDDHSRGDLLSRVTNDIDNIGQSLQQSLTQLITSVLTVIGVLIMMFTISWELALISLLAIPASLIVTVLIIRRSQKLFVAQWASTGALNGQVEEVHTGHNIVTVFGRQEESSARFEEENERLYQASYRAQFISGIIQPAISLISNLNYVAIAVIGGLRVASGPDVARRCRRVHPVFAPVHAANRPGGEHRQRAPVGGGVGRARVRAARRGRDGARPRAAQGARRVSAARSRSTTSRSATCPIRRSSRT